MKVRTKLGIAIALPVLLLGAMLLLHARTTRRVVGTAYELTAVWSHVHRTSIEQLERVARLEEYAAKFRVTQDPGYLSLLHDLMDAFERDLKMLQLVPLDDQARAEIQALASAWEAFAPLPQRMSERRAMGAADLDQQLAAGAAELARQTERVSQASLEAMVTRFSRSQLAARRAERASLASGVVALALSTLIALLVVRSIAGPISRLAAGTLEVGEGRFEHRLDDNRNDEFARVATEFNRMARRLGEVDRTQRDFISRISHDLKTPLAAMQETTDLLLEGVAGPLTLKQQRLLQLHGECSARLSRMLTQLLDLSRLEARPDPVVAAIPVAELVRDAVDFAVAGASSPDPRITATGPDEPVTVWGDPDGIRRLLDNLLHNALKFSPPDSPIRVDCHLLHSRPRWIPSFRWVRGGRVGVPDGVLHLSVADAGPGIPDAEKNLVFSRFHQAGRRDGTQVTGVGLGLTICREVALAHGGTIWAADNPGGGTIFHVLIPGAERGAPVPTEVPPITPTMAAV